MKYFLLFFNSVISSFSKIPVKKYQDDTLWTESGVNIYLILNCLFGIVFYASLSGGSLTPNLPTVIFSAAFAANVICSNLILLFAVRKADLTSIAVFSGAGGVIIPIVFGVFFLGENMSVFKIIAVVLLLIVVILPIFENTGVGKKSLEGYIFCLLTFTDAGVTSVICKLYAINPNVLDDKIFCFWTNIIILPFVIAMTLKMNGAKTFILEARQIKIKTYLCALLTMLIGSVGTLLTLFVFIDIDAVVSTITSSSTVLICTALFARIFFKEKITPRTVFSVALSIAAIILNLF